MAAPHPTAHNVPHYPGRGRPACVSTLEQRQSWKTDHHSRSDENPVVCVDCFYFLPAHVDI